METAALFVIGLIVGVITTMVAVFIALWNEEQANNPWHDYNESPENKTHVLVFDDGHYRVMFYRDAMYEDPVSLYCQNRVDRWMYIPGNVKHKAPKQ